MASQVANHGNGLYDICRTTCCHVYGTSQFTNSNLAVDSTKGWVLVSNGRIQLSEYAAEQNNFTACGDGFVGNGTTTWPCKPDSPCTGQKYNGHGRGMCQNGSARWATGWTFTNSSCTWIGPHGFGQKTWQEILTHYYPNWSLAQCGTSTCPPPANDICTGAIELLPAAGCSFKTFSTDCASQSLAALANCNGFTLGNSDDDVWFKFNAQAGQAYTVQLLNGNNFDGVLDIRSACAGVSLACDDQPGTAGITNTATINSASAQAYYIRVYHYGSGSGGGSFQICVSTAAPCTTPGPPVEVKAVSTGINTANLSWAKGNPEGGDPLTYYWVVGDNPEVKYGDGVAYGTTKNTSATTNALLCSSTYYLRVYAFTGCNNTFSPYSTFGPFTTLNVDTSVTISGSTLTANATGATYQWINCSNMSNIIGATSQAFTPQASGSYAVRVMQGNCTAISKCLTFSSVQGASNNLNLIVYPNPVREALYVRGSGLPAGNYEIRLYNALGQLMYSSEEQISSAELELEIDMKPFNSGLFLLVVKSKKIRQVLKVQKL
jgi:hypothetical protein